MTAILPAATTVTTDQESPEPSAAPPDFCEYDEPTKSYRYTKAYVQHLIRKCTTAEGFAATTGMSARLRTETST